MEETGMEMGEWDATCVSCAHTMMDQDWETDRGPDGLEDVRFCPMCGEQLGVKREK